METGVSVEFPLALAGLAVKWRLGDKLARGTLLNGRYSLLQLKNSMNEGEYYIALDQALADYCFVALWEKENEDWRYHWHIRKVSSIKEVGEDLFYSVFSPQEGLPLVEALMRLGWSRLRVWEIIRQVCILLSPVHDEGEYVGYIHPDNLWVQNDGQVLFSTQRQAEKQSSSWQEEIQTLIRLLFWLLDPQNKMSAWTMIPFKLQSFLQECWENPIPAEKFWQGLERTLQKKGWFHLSEEGAKRLLNHHFPNLVLLGGAELEIPDTVQLCVWNTVTGSWRLKNGFLLLQTNVMSLFENGFVEQENDLPVIEWIREITKGNRPTIAHKTMEAILMLHYGDARQGNLILAEAMRETSSFADWLMIARVLITKRDRKGVERAIRLAEHWASSLEEHLDIAAMLRWEEGDISWTRRKLQSLVPQNAMECLMLAEAWYALFSAENKTALLWEKAQELHRAEDGDEDLEQEMKRRFGTAILR